VSPPWEGVDLGHISSLHRRHRIGVEEKEPEENIYGPVGGLNHAAFRERARGLEHGKGGTTSLLPAWKRRGAQEGLSQKTEARSGGEGKFGSFLSARRKQKARAWFSQQAGNEKKSRHNFSYADQETLI